MNENIENRSIEEDRQLVFDLLDNLPIGVMAVNTQFKPIFVNETLAELVGLPVKTLLKVDLVKYTQWYKSSSGKHMSDCLQGFQVEDRGELRNAAGELIPVRLNGLPLYTKLGQIDGVVILCTDLRQQLVWERSFSEYKHILDSISAGVIAIDLNQIVTTCNQQVSKVWNKQPHQLIGRTLSELRAELGYKFAFLEQTLNSGEPVSVPEYWWEQDGKEWIFALECNPLKDDADKTIGAVSVWRDISLQRKIELEANRAEKLAVVGELAASTAHEIRNPLTSIRGFIQLLENRLSPDSAEQDYLKIMLSELDRANAIIGNFLLLAKPQHPKLQIQDLNYVLDELIKLIEAQALMAEVQLIRRLCSDMPFMVMETESIKQVFLNLLQNAIQAMPTGGTLTIYSEFVAEENLALVRITDTGIGMSRDMLTKLGHPFFTTRTNGTGLGLAVSYRIIENHKGTIEVVSSENQGTTFIIKLPVS